MIGTGAEQVGTPQDTPGCTKTLHERLEALITMVQVWDRLKYYMMVDEIARAKRRHQARMAKMFGSSEPYRNFDLNGRYMSGIEPRPDRPWDRFGEFAEAPPVQTSMPSPTASSSEAPYVPVAVELLCRRSPCDRPPLVWLTWLC